MTLEKTAADFFAGIGLTSAALIRQNWEIKYALDHSEAKRRMYDDHFGRGHYHVEDIRNIAGESIPQVTLAHASFPCTDTSIAGSRNGLESGESSMFWEFARILSEMGLEQGPGKPPVILVENVEGLLTSGKGHDLLLLLRTLNRLQYGIDILLIDAAHFVPQSRVRLFVVGILDCPGQPPAEREKYLKRSNARPEKIRRFIRKHPDIRWCIRDLPDLPERELSLENIIDLGAEWWPEERSSYLFNQMFDRHKEEIRRLMAENQWSYRTVFRRMRMRDGRKQSTAEVRTDGIAGCLRTPKGGSARQIIVRAGMGRFDARLLNAKENARLMGAMEYKISDDLPLNEALFGFGDAVCVPVVDWLGANYLNPVADEYPDFTRDRFKAEPVFQLKA
jgi:DNA (cytosine-5)-methyltransferase 1